MGLIRSLADSRGLVLHSTPFLRRMNEEDFFELCQENRDLRIERNSDGDLVIMPPTGSETGSLNAEFTTELTNWARKDGTGKVFDSSTGFTLPNGATRSPDAAWITLARWKALP